MSQNENSGNSSPRISWGTKVGYIGTGVLVGLVIYPFVRKTLAKVQPKVDKLFDALTGKAEDLAERAADLMAKAKDNLYRTEVEVESETEPKTKKAAHKHAKTGDTVQ